MIQKSFRAYVMPGGIKRRLAKLGGMTLVFFFLKGLAWLVLPAVLWLVE